MVGNRSGTMLVAARRAAGLTQAALAERAGVAREAVSQYETGTREAGADTFLRLLTATGAVVTCAGTEVGVDAWRNSEVFASLSSVLDAGVPVREPGGLAFPAQVWREGP
jgi:transcriptional regulator with XRE-family HTH domain